MFTPKSPQKRLYQLDRPIIALTGGIGTGKSTVAKMLKDLGFPIIDADELVKTIYKKPASVSFIAKHFPDCVEKQEIIFPKLREAAFAHPEAKTLIENFIYPQMEGVFKQKLSSFDEKKFVIYDVPLLFERQLDKLVDFIVLVYAPKATQIERVMARDNSSQELAEKIISSQIDIETKKKQSHYIVDNSLPLDELKPKVEAFSSKLRTLFKMA